MIVGEPVWMDADKFIARLGKDPFDVMMSGASSLIRTPATPDRLGTENRNFLDAGSKTSTASFAVCAT